MGLNGSKAKPLSIYNSMTQFEPVIILCLKPLYHERQTALYKHIEKTFIMRLSLQCDTNLVISSSFRLKQSFSLLLWLSRGQEPRKKNVNSTDFQL